MSLTITCCHCGLIVPRNPRIKKGQQYCNARACQNARIGSWRKKKRISSKSFRNKCKELDKNWHMKRPAHDYQREYRAKNPDYVVRNRELQKTRNKNNRQCQSTDIRKKIVKSNTLSRYPFDGDVYRIIPYMDKKIVKSNAFLVRMQLL